MLACRDCNDLKGDLTVEQFTAAVTFIDAMEFKPEMTRRRVYKPLRNWGSLRDFWKAVDRGEGTGSKAARRDSSATVVCS